MKLQWDLQGGEREKENKSEVGDVERKTRTEVEKYASRYGGEMIKLHVFCVLLVINKKKELITTLPFVFFFSFLSSSQHA